jgi:hypothetical protein
MAPEPLRAGVLPPPANPATDENLQPGPPPLPQIVVHAASTAYSGPAPAGAGRSLTETTANYPQHAPALAAPAAMPPMPFKSPDVNVRSAPPPSAPIIVPPFAAMPPMPSASPPEAGFIPIMHRKPVPDRINTSAAAAAAAKMPPMPPTPSSDDDGFTPVTPGSGVSPQGRSPRSQVRAKGGILEQLSPRDALGIPVSKILARVKSKKVTIVDPRKDDDEFEDVTPLSPSRDLEAQRERQGVRRTLFGLIEGWWDLGLLDRSKSLKRKG